MDALLLIKWINELSVCSLSWSDSGNISWSPSETSFSSDTSSFSPVGWLSSNDKARSSSEETDCSETVSSDNRHHTHTHVQWCCFLVCSDKFHLFWIFQKILADFHNKYPKKNDGAGSYLGNKSTKQENFFTTTKKQNIAKNLASKINIKTLRNIQLPCGFWMVSNSFCKGTLLVGCSSAAPDWWLTLLCSDVASNEISSTWLPGSGEKPLSASGIKGMLDEVIARVWVALTALTCTPMDGTVLKYTKQHWKILSWD